MDPYKITFKTWNKVALLYQEKFMHLDLYNDSYALFCQLLQKQNAAILEIGCGPGNITKYMVAARPGYEISAIDIAPAMIELAKTNNPTVSFSVMDCRDIAVIGGKFDGIICGFCVPYLSKTDCSKLFKDVFYLLNPAGLFYFSVIQGDYDRSGFETASTGDRCYVYYYDETYLQNELVKNGFTLVSLTRIDFPKNDGTSQVNLVFIAQKDPVLPGVLFDAKA